MIESHYYGNILKLYSDNSDCMNLDNGDMRYKVYI